MSGSHFSERRQLTANSSWAGWLRRTALMPSGRQGGVALVLVLWVIVLLTIIAVSQVATQRTELSMTLNARQERAGRALVDAGTNFMVWQLLEAKGEEPDQIGWPADGLQRPWIFAGSEIRVSALPETTRIDLNTAAPELLVGLLRSAGLGEGEAAKIKDAMLDWRDPDSNHRLNGAEDADYRTAGLLYGARDADFDSVGEVRMVLGVTQALFARIAPALTVYSGQRSINPVFASPGVLQAIPGMTPDQVTAYLALRTRRLEQGLSVPLPVGGKAGVLSGNSSSVYRVHAETSLPDGGWIAGELVVDVGKGGDKGYMTLERSYPVLPAPREKAATVEQEQVE